MTPQDEKVRDATVQVMASLAAAISLLERSPKTAAPSDKMFDQMLVDYRKALDSARDILTASPPPDTKVRPEDLGDHNVLLEDHLRQQIESELASVKPRIVLGDDDSIYLTERQEGFKEGLSLVLELLKGKP